MCRHIHVRIKNSTQITDRFIKNWYYYTIYGNTKNGDKENFHEIFNFGIDFVERMYEIIDIPFWKDVLGSLKILLKSDTCTTLHHVCTTPLWYNNLLKLPLKHK